MKLIQILFRKSILKEKQPKDIILIYIRTTMPTEAQHKASCKYRLVHKEGLKTSMRAYMEIHGAHYYQLYRDEILKKKKSILQKKNHMIDNA